MSLVFGHSPPCFLTQQKVPRELDCRIVCLFMCNIKGNPQLFLVEIHVICRTCPAFLTARVRTVVHVHRQYVISYSSPSWWEYNIETCITKLCQAALHRVINALIITHRLNMDLIQLGTLKCFTNTYSGNLKI